MSATLLDSPLISKLALEWCRAEHLARVARGDDTGGFVPHDEELAIASDRVFQVCMGEVRWSDCGPGDKAIWKGRMRDVERFEQMWRESPRPRENVAAHMDAEDERAERDRMNYPGAGGRGPQTPAEAEEARRPRGQGNRRLGIGPRLVGAHQRQWFNWYDTLEVKRSGNSYRLFNNKNVGQLFLCNLDMPGTLAHDSTVVITSLYVSISSMAALRWAADNIQVQWIVGDKPATPRMFVRDLFMGIPLLRPIVVPIRQNVGVNVDLRSAPPDDVELFDLTVHADGLITRDTP